MISPLKLIASVFLFLLFYAGNAQELAQSLENHFIRFTENHPVENTNIHPGQKVYFTGDTLHMTGFVTDLFFRPTASMSKIVHVSLLDSAGKLIQTFNFKNENGAYSGAWQIPHKLSSGAYYLAAHTLYQENFTENLSDIEEIFIQNIWEKPSYQKSKSGTDLKCYAEGGMLIKGHNQRVVFTVPGLEKFMGTITDPLNNKVAEFEMNEGYGAVFFTPEASGNYNIMVKNDQGVSLSNMIEVEERWATIQVNKVGSRYYVSVLGNEIKDPLHIILESNNMYKTTIPVQFNEQQVSTFTIPANSLNGNFHTLTLINSRNQIVAIRPFYSLPEKADLTPQTDSLISKDQISIGVSMIPKGTYHTYVGKTDAINHISSLSNKLAMSYGMLPSWERIVGNYSYMDPDNYLITQTKHFKTKWNNLLKDQDKTALTIAPEIGIDIRGKVEPLPESGSKIDFFQWENEMSYAIDVQPDGSFYLPLKDFDNLQTFTYDVRGNQGKLQDVKVKFQLPKLSIPKMEFETSEEADSLISQQIELKQISAQYLNSQSEKKPLLYDILPHDHLYDMEDYVILKHFHEIVADVLQEVSIRQIHGKKGFRINDLSTSKMYFEEPTVIINNTQLANSNLLWAVPPIYIAEIKVLNTKPTLSRFENMGNFSGLIGIRLHDDAPKDFTEPTKNHNLTIAGFLQKNTQRPDSSIPDFRNVLTNKTALVTASWSIALSASSEIGKYSCKIEGLSDSGELISGNTKLKIFLQKNP